MTPQNYLQQGANILAAYLNPLGFCFEIRGIGRGSGGNFAYGQFIKKGLLFKKSKVIELHFRYTLGLVSYHLDNISLGHQDFIDILGKKGENKYPGYSENQLDAFYDLLHDLKVFLTDFTEGDASLFRQKAPAKIKELTEESRLMQLKEQKLFSGDTHRIEKAKQEFKKRNYSAVAILQSQLQYPELLTETEIRLFKLNSDRLENGH